MKKMKKLLAVVLAAATVAAGAAFAVSAAKTSASQFADNKDVIAYQQSIKDLEAKQKELKDKLKLKGAPAAQGDNFASEQTDSVMQEATNALLVLGYSRAEAVAALRRVSGALSLEELITAALKQLAKG